MSFFTPNRLRFVSSKKRRGNDKFQRKLQVTSLEERFVPAAPVIDPIADRTLITNQSILQVPVVTSDADGNQVAVSVRTAASADYFLLSDLKLTKASRPMNWGGESEKWFTSKGNWYFLMPDGELSRWDGTLHQASGEQVATLPPVYYFFTDLVTKPHNQDLASLLNQRLGLQPTVSPQPNKLGLNEKWLAGTGGARYFLLPDGSFYRATGASLGVRTLFASLSPTYYQNPTSLFDAIPRRLIATARGSMIQIGSTTGTAGDFAVQVQASDGTSASTRNFAVHVASVTPPELPEQQPQVLGVGEQSLSFNLGATDADGDTLTYSVEVAGSDAYFLAKDLGLKGSLRPTNWAKQGEKWFKGQGSWYFLLPSGDLYKWDNTRRQASGDYIATLPPLYHVYPDLLTGPRSQDLAYVIDQKLGLSPTGNPKANSLSLNEKWLGGTNPNIKFFITPEGTLYRRTGTSMNLLAELGRGYYDQPARLYAASRDRFNASVDDNGTLTINTKPNFAGKFSVQVSVTDGSFTTKQVIPVTQSDYVSQADPRVVGAVSHGNRTVVVAFSQPMNNAATDPTNYEIAQIDAAGNSIASLSVTSVRFIGVDRTAVELTTDSQSEVKYAVKAVNVKDLGGRPIAPTSIQAGVLIDPSRATFMGKPPTAAEMIDTDGDGLLDYEETRGWNVQVQMLNGSVANRWVTSDPSTADSDNDGLPDYQEANLRLDPRDQDTDDDQLTDAQEFNELYSDPANQDTDGDSLDDNVEFTFYHSSLVQADTDGDQVSDGDEILLGNRNVRIADVPKPAIEVGAVDLALDVRFTATSSFGTRELESKTVSSTLTQSSRREFSREDSNSHEVAVKGGVEFGWSTEVGEKGVGTEGKVSFEAGWTGTWSSNFTDTSAKETQETAERSLQTDKETTQDETTERTVEGATMKVAVKIQALTSLAFTISNLQVTAFVQDPETGSLVPVATLLPEGGVQDEFTLGPLVPERGPFIFTNDQIYPSLVEKLMMNPRGLVFKISNYDIVDERGRNFAFTSEEINDRTAPLVIDFGFGDASNSGLGGGTTERYRVATSGGRIAIDTNGDNVVDANDRPVVFDGNGKTVGITIGDALQYIVGLTKYDEDATPTSSLSRAQVLSSFSTRIGADGVERLWRVRGISKQINVNKDWFVVTPDGIDVTTNFSDHTIDAGGGLTLKFMQDLDGDGLDAAQEYILGTSDTNSDSDGDNLPDADEFFGRTGNQIGSEWIVNVAGKDSVRAFSNPARKDSDGDGISDHEEIYPVGVNRTSTDPRNPDSDGDGISDFEEINGYTVNVRFPTAHTIYNVTTDPLKPDSDGDTLSDGDERRLGTNPTDDKDADGVLDDDGDGLVNFVENSGWGGQYYGVSSTPFNQGSAGNFQEHPSRNDPDSDDDGLTDREEFLLQTNPNSADTDGDGLTDLQEVTINNNTVPRTVTLKFNPLDADIDNDLRSDGNEVKTPISVSIEGQNTYQVFSDPTKADEDLDQLVDGQELTYGTDPKKFDTDGDNAGIGDKREIDLGTNPLVKDQKVTVTITQFQLLKFDGVDEIGSTSLQMYGNVVVGVSGDPNQPITSLYDLNGLDLKNDQAQTVNVTKSFILRQGQSLHIENQSIEDRDKGSSPDPFSNAQKEFEYGLSSTTGSITSIGLDTHEPVSDDEIGAEFVTSFALKVES